MLQHQIYWSADCINAIPNEYSGPCWCLQTGVAHAEAGGYEAAEAAFSRAHEQCMRLMKDLENAGISESQLCELSTSSVDLLLDRLVNAWKLQQTVHTDPPSLCGTLQAWCKQMQLSWCMHLC